MYKLDCDFDRVGHQQGNLLVEVGNGEQWNVPVSTFSSGSGANVLLTGAIHGDEYEGPIALRKLLAKLASRYIAGRVTVVPSVNFSATEAMARCAPEDNLDLNRCFPGDSGGSPTERLANAISQALLPHADVVIDCHTGGGAYLYTPCAMMHPLSNQQAYKRTLDLIRAMRLPAGVVIDESDKPGMFDTYVESMGKPFVCCEFGGGGVSAETVALASIGLENALIHLGLIDGDLRFTHWRGRNDARLLEVPSQTFYVASPVRGLFEPLLEIGDSIEAGEPVANVYALDGGPAVQITSPHDGVLFVRRARGFIETDQRAVIIARAGSQ